MLLLGLLCLLASNIQGILSIPSETEIWRTYGRTNDMDEFCDSYVKHYSRECSDSVTDDDELHFQGLLDSKDSYRIVCYVNEVLLKVDESYIMDDDTCSNFWDEIDDAKPREVVDIINSQVNSMGLTYEFQRTRSNKLLAKKIKQLSETKRCDIKLIAMPFGNVRKRWSLSNIPFPKLPGNTINPIVYTIANGIKTLWEWRSSEFDKAEKEILAEAANRREMDEASAERVKIISDHERECYLNDDFKACKKLNRLMDEFIHDISGIWHLRIVKSHPNSREALYTLAKFRSGISHNWFLNQFDFIGRSVQAVGRYWPLVLSILVIVLIGYRAELRTLTSVALAFNGLSIIPTVSLVRIIGSSLIDRFSGLLVAVVVLITTAGLQNNIIAPGNAVAIIYGTIVLYVNAIRVSSSYWAPILSFIPVLAYALLRDASLPDLSNLTIKSIPSFTTNPTTIASNIQGLLHHSIPSILSCATIAIGIAIYATANYCDSIGYNYYRDVANHYSKAKPGDKPNTKVSFMEYLSNFFCFNNLILLGCVMIPGITFADTWVMSAAIGFLAMIIGAVCYQYMFHDDYVREGETTGSTKDRVMESMNIISGVAPRNIILPKFKNCVKIGLICMAFTAGLRQDTFAGIAISGLVSIALFKNPYDVQEYLHYFCGLSLLICGSVPHAIIGVLYLFMRIGNILEISTFSMRSGETIRAIDVDPH